MGTYTTNYNLFMPSVGERGWGELVNGNFTTIDTTMKGLSTRLTAVESEVNGALNCTSVATSGTITSNGMLNANGGVKGGTITGTTITATNKFSGTLYGKIYVNAKYTTAGGLQVSTCAKQTLTNNGGAYGEAATSSTITVGGYASYTPSFPLRLSAGIYVPSASYLSGSIPTSVSRPISFTVKYDMISSASSNYANLYKNNSLFLSSYPDYGESETLTGTVKNGDKLYIIAKGVQSSFTINALSTYYIQDV